MRWIIYEGHIYIIYLLIDLMAFSNLELSTHFVSKDNSDDPIILCGVVSNNKLFYSFIIYLSYIYVIYLYICVWC